MQQQQFEMTKTQIERFKNSKDKEVINIDNPITHKSAFKIV